MPSAPDSAAPIGEAQEDEHGNLVVMHPSALRNQGVKPPAAAQPTATPTADRTADTARPAAVNGQPASSSPAAPRPPGHDAAAPGAVPVLTGSAAVLARIRAQRAAPPSGDAAAPAPSPAANGKATGPAAAPGTEPSKPAPAAPAAASVPAPAAVPTPAAAPASAPPPAAAPTAPAAAAAAAPVALTGSAALLARIRAQRAAPGGGGAAADSKPAPKVAVLYASQTGTGREIAHSIHAECAAKGIPSQVMSFNELGFANLLPERYPVVVAVASSTGDGDPPDNGAAAWVAMKKPQPPGRLAGMAFTVLGLGDSNYTRYMHVPRVFKNRFQELGATMFYSCSEADEVDGLEGVVDVWVDGLWAPMQKALAAAAAGAKPAAAAAGAKDAPAAGGVKGVATLKAAAGATAAATLPPPSPAPAGTREGGAAAPADVGLVDGLAPVGADLAGVPALAPCRVRIDTRIDTAVAARVRASEAAPTQTQLKHRDPSGDYSPERPFWARLSGARLLTAPSSDRRVLHLEFDLADSGMRYGPGDAVGVLPQNDPALVAALLERLGADGGQVFKVSPTGDAATGGASLLPHLGCPCTLRHALSRGVDVTAPPRKSLLRLLAEHCSAPPEKRTLLFLTARAGRDAYAREVTQAQPGLLDLLRRFPSCRPPLAALLDALPPLAPRLYSATSAPCASPTSVQVALSVVSFPTPHGTRRGVATSWLDRLAAPLLAAGGGGAAGAAAAASAPLVPLFLRRSESFKPPASPATPMVMIGPGTGVAPFRGFLQHREAQLRDAAAAAAGKGQALLFFGCRRAEEDYLYRQDLEGFAQAGVLSRLHVAFSRAQATKRYVQHVLEEQAAEVAAAVAGGAHVYVCGDGAGMARDVHAALKAVLVRYGGMGEDAAAELLTRMTKEGRYVRDVWS